MNSPHSFTRSSIVLVAFAAMASQCSPPSAGSSATPFLTELRNGDSVRNLVVTQYGGSAQLGEPASCSLDTWLFDVNMPATMSPMAMEADCALYPAGASLPVEQQNWICAGAIIANHGGMNEGVTLCPGMAPIGVHHDLTCGGITPGASVQLSSGTELDGDTVTDLDVAATLPGVISITMPTNLGVLTWPSGGGFEVRWESAMSSSAVVVISARNTPSATPTIVCRPSAQGTTAVSPTLIDMAGFRTIESVLRVTAYRDVTTTAEGGARTYHVWGGVQGAVLLQALH